MQKENWDFLVDGLIVLLPEVFLVLSASLLLIYGVLVGSKVQLTEDNQKTQPIVPVIWLSIQTALIASLLVLNGDYAESTILYGCLKYDNLSQGVKGLLLLFTAGVLYICPQYLRAQGIRAYEYSILILMSALGMVLLVSSTDLIALYLAVELQSLALYVLASFQRGSAFSTEAGLKYFVVGAFSSGLLLFGCSLIYGFTGATNYEDLSRLLLANDEIQTSLLAGLLFVTVALLFKLTAAPFHMWAPDVYEGSPSSSTLFFASIPKIAIITALLRLCQDVFYDCMTFWQSILIMASLCSMVVAALAAFYQRKIKRFLAYSSIGHVGYMLIAIACGTLQGIQGVLLYTIIYMVMTLNIWAILLSTKNKNHGGTIKYMDELAYMGRQNPYLTFTLTATMFSMAGIPPLAGFCAKMYVFFAAMEASLYGVAVIAVLTSVVGAFYYIRWIKILFFDNINRPKTSTALLASLPSTVTVYREQSLILGITTLFICFFFSYPTPFLLFTHKLALTLC